MHFSFPVEMIIFLVVLVFTASKCLGQDNGKFPKDFLFGAATSAYQVEGAWNVDGRGPSVWDTLTHSKPAVIADGQNCDIGPDSYHFYEEDIKAIKSLGMHFYRFSISWSRILPTGDISNVNEPGIAYYNRLIDTILKYKIKPMATMIHYDLPEELQKFGGLTNDITIQHFKSYANLLFDRFGDRVKLWITFNEPANLCLLSYGTGDFAPQTVANGIGEYLCGDIVLKAHALVYRLHKEHYASQNGKIGITLSSRYFYSPTNSTYDVERALQFYLGWFAQPIFGKNGDYPEVMKQQINGNSICEGRDRSRLPPLSKYWIDIIRGSADFMGFNYYTSRMVERGINSNDPNPSFARDTNLMLSANMNWKQSKSTWLYLVPDGIRQLLRYIKTNFNNPEVIITENGWPDGGQLDDVDRIAYFREHLNELLTVVQNNECNVTGYTAWAIIDNFEWLAGYTERFGLFSVNFTSPSKERIPKASSTFMHEVIATRRIPPN